MERESQGYGSGAAKDALPRPGGSLVSLGSPYVCELGIALGRDDGRLRIIDCRACWVEPGNPMRVSQPSGVGRVHPARCSEGFLYTMNDACKAKVSDVCIRWRPLRRRFQVYLVKQ